MSKLDARITRRVGRCQQFKLSLLITTPSLAMLAGCVSSSVVTSTELSGTAPVALTGRIHLYGVGRSSVQVTLSLTDNAPTKTDGATANSSTSAGDAVVGGGNSTAPAASITTSGDAAKAAIVIKPAIATSPARASIGTKPKTKPASSGATATTGVTQAASCKDLRTAYRSGRFAYLGFLDNTNALISRLNVLSDTSGRTEPASDADVQAVIAGVTSFLADSPAAFNVAALANATYPTIEDECPTPVAVNLTHVVEADPRLLFEVTLNTDDLSTDTLTMKTDETGLPVLVDTSADDQTGTFLTNVATSIGTIVGAFKPFPVSASFFNASLELDSTSTIGEPSRYGKLSLAELVAALKGATSDRRVIIRYLDQAIKALLPAIPTSIDPVVPVGPQTYVVSELEAAPKVLIDGIGLQAICGIALPPAARATPAPPVVYAGIVAALPRPCVIRVVTLTSQSTSIDIDALRRSVQTAEATARAGAKPAVVGRGVFIDDLIKQLPPTPALTTAAAPAAMPTATGTSAAAGAAAAGDAEHIAVAGRRYDVGPDLARVALMALDSRSLFVVPIERTRFVKRTAHVEFSSGQVVDVELTRPSPATAAAALPGQIIGGVLGGIVSGVTGRTNITKQDTDLINARANLLTAEAAYKAVANGAPTTSSSSTGKSSTTQ